MWITSMDSHGAVGVSQNAGILIAFSLEVCGKQSWQYVTFAKTFLQNEMMCVPQMMKYFCDKTGMAVLVYEETFLL